MCKNGSSLGENLLWLFVQKGIDSSLKEKKKKERKNRKKEEEEKEKGWERKWAEICKEKCTLVRELLCEDEKYFKVCDDVFLV